MEKIFFDTEFTGLVQNTTLISIGCVAESGPTFYAEFGDFNYLLVDDWIQKNVVDKLLFYYHLDNRKGWCNSSTLNAGEKNAVTEVFGNSHFISECLTEWFKSFDKVEMWSDCLAYDWVLFNNLWGHAFSIPDNIFYIPMDICTMFKLKNIDPDINREEFVESFIKDKNTIKKHNALWDAKVIKMCYDKLSELAPQINL
jgi:hypothetical protein